MSFNLMESIYALLIMSSSRCVTGKFSRKFSLVTPPLSPLDFHPITLANTFQRPSIDSNASMNPIRASRITILNVHEVNYFSSATRTRLASMFHSQLARFYYICVFTLDVFARTSYLHRFVLVRRTDRSNS
jgi:hypothetical protein